jgi:hypothetical protein
LLLHQTILGGVAGLHLAIAVLHSLPLHGAGLSAVAASRRLLAASSATTTTTGHRFWRGEAE